MADLSTKKLRNALPSRTKNGTPRDAPHWHRLAEGAYLGFRKSSETWLARWRDSEGIQQYEWLGEALEFDDAKKKAEEWIARMTGAAVRSPKRDTVRAALETYLAWMAIGRPGPAKEVEARFKLTIYGDKLAKLSLEKMTSDDFSEWRDRLRDGRQPRSVNPIVRSVIAALNYAHTQKGHVGNPIAWRIKALADDVDDADAVETAVYLKPAERKAIIAAASPTAAQFFRGLEMTGARPKELAAALVSHFSAENKNLRLASRKGRKSIMRVRYVELITDEDVAFFESMTKDRTDLDSPIFSVDGKGERPWSRHVWARAMVAAIAKHNEGAKGRDRLEPGIGAYSFRHSRISELLQVHGIDPLTTAQQTGTSGAMIEKHYLKFIPSAMRLKIAAIKAKAA